MFVCFERTLAMTFANVQIAVAKSLAESTAMGAKLGVMFSSKKHLRV